MAGVLGSASSQAKSPAPIDAHQELAQAAVPAHDPVDRERVEDLVRDDGTRADAFVLVAGIRQGPGKPIGGQAFPEGLDSRRLHLDGVVRDGREQGRPRVPESPEEPGRQRSRSGTRFRDGERGGAAQRVPRLLQQPADRGPEDRVGLGGREEVGACRPGSRLRAPVVPVAGRIERELHEPGKGDGSVPLDLLLDPSDELAVLADGLRVRQRLAAEAGLHRHDLAPAVSASRAPGPTSVWPPSSTGTRAPRADAVSDRSHGSWMRSGSRRSLA